VALAAVVAQEMALVAPATRQTLRRRKVMTVEQEAPTEPHTQTAVAVVEQALRVALLLAATAVTAVTEPRLAFLDRR
jgi:hypothetical protein